MNELEIKKVPFLGTELMAARDADGTIWAGVRWMCEGIGLSEGQTKNERLKIQKDKVLTKGGRNFVLNESGYGNREVLFLKLDFVPLWLAKISITPTMEQEAPLAGKNQHHTHDGAGGPGTGGASDGVPAQGKGCVGSGVCANRRRVHQIIQGTASYLHAGQPHRTA